MYKKYTNPCIRCGKERIVVRMWTEVIPTFSGAHQEIVRKDNVCPDPLCQEILNKEFAVQKRKRQKIAQEKEKRLKDNKTKKDLLRKLAQKKYRN